MKVSILLLLFYIPCLLSAQQTDSLGLDNLAMLTQKEAAFFTTMLQDKRGDFDFEHKKVAFVTGSAGTVVLTKRDYFEGCIRPWTDTDARPQIFFVALTEDEKIRSGGYDAIVLSWVKLFTARNKRKIIQSLGQAAKT